MRNDPCPAASESSASSPLNNRGIARIIRGMKTAVAAVGALAALGLLAVVLHRLSVEADEETARHDASHASSNPSGILRAEDDAPGEVYESWYPADITPPPGTKYPCAVTAMPKDLEGVPPSHKRYIDHAFSLILKAVHARLGAWEALGSPAPDPAILENYLAVTRDVAAKLKAEPTPWSLLPFRDDVIAGLEFQISFFEKAYPLRRSGKSFEEWSAVPEGRTASGKLITAWGRIQARYPKMSAAVSASLMHHLCALDIF